MFSLSMYLKTAKRKSFSQIVVLHTKHSMLIHRWWYDCWPHSKDHHSMKIHSLVDQCQPTLKSPKKTNIDLNVFTVKPNLFDWNGFWNSMWWGMQSHFIQVMRWAIFMEQNLRFGSVGSTENFGLGRKECYFCRQIFYVFMGNFF